MMHQHELKTPRAGEIVLIKPYHSSRHFYVAQKRQDNGEPQKKQLCGLNLLAMVDSKYKVLKAKRPEMSDAYT
jgi:hypothetical protein